MNIAIDISPLDPTSPHAVRGSGFYIKHLMDALKHYEKDHTSQFFTDNKEIKNTDLVHHPYFEPFFLTLPLKKKIPTVVTVHDLMPLVFPQHFPAGLKGNIKWRIQRRSLMNCNAIITDSETSKKDIIKYTGIPSKKVHVVYLAASGEFKKIENRELRFENLRKEYTLPEKFVLYVGDVTWNKNLPRLVEVVKKVDVPFVMVGKALAQEQFDDSNYWNKDLSIVRQMIAGDNKLITLGFVPTEDLVMLYNLATVFVMPSLYEGFGLPILEAMSCGCPVVTSEEGSLPEVAGNAAYYVDAYDCDSIGRGIEKVWNDRKLQKILSEKGLEQAKKFSWEKTAKETIAVYKKVLEAR